MNSIIDRRRFMIAAGLAATFSLANDVHAEQKEDRQDGFWWDQQNMLEKLSFINGFVTMSAKAIAIIPLIVQQAGLRQNARLEAMTKNNFDFSGIAYGQYLEGADKFYKDFRNRRIQIEDAMHYIKSEIAGSDPKKLESEILSLRKFATSE